MSADLIERLRTRRIPFGIHGELLPDDVSIEAADAIAAKDTALSEMAKERDEARASWRQAIDLYEMEVARVDPALAAGCEAARQSVDGISAFKAMLPWQHRVNQSRSAGAQRCRPGASGEWTAAWARFECGKASRPNTRRPRSRVPG